MKIYSTCGFSFYSYNPYREYRWSPDPRPIYSVKLSMKLQFSTSLDFCAVDLRPMNMDDLFIFTDIFLFQNLRW